MKAVVKNAFQGREDNSATVRTIDVGETISGELAAVAVAEGWAEAESFHSPLDDGDGFSKMSIAALVDVAETENIDLGDAKKKAEIIAAIRAARNAAPGA